MTASFITELNTLYNFCITQRKCINMENEVIRMFAGPAVEIKLIRVK